MSLDTFDRVLRSEDFGNYYTQKLLAQITNEGRIFLALDGETVAGMVAVGIKPRMPEDDLQIQPQKYGEIEMLLVLEQYRSQGIGLHLLKMAEEYLIKEAGCDFVKIVVFGDNHRSLAMYQSNGYRQREVVLLKKAA